MISRVKIISTPSCTPATGNNVGDAWDANLFQRVDVARRNIILRIRRGSTCTTSSTPSAVSHLSERVGLLANAIESLVVSMLMMSTEAGAVKASCICA